MAGVLTAENGPVRGRFGRWAGGRVGGGRRRVAGGPLRTLFWELVHLYQLGLTRFPTQNRSIWYNCVHEWHNYTGVVWYNCDM